jgi:hypothetical protein
MALEIQMDWALSPNDRSQQMPEGLAMVVTPNNGLKTVILLLVDRFNHVEENFRTLERSRIS